MLSGQTFAERSMIGKLLRDFICIWDVNYIILTSIMKKMTKSIIKVQEKCQKQNQRNSYPDGLDFSKDYRVSQKTLGDLLRNF
jgi:hypothetical protein